MRTRSSFHNTINSGPDLFTQQDAQCKKQEERVLQIFELNSFRWLTTLDVWAIYLTKYEYGVPENRKVPHDSIKRSITNICDKNRGPIMKCETKDMVMGTRGKRVYTWKLNTNK